jgi:hypothetical protein
MQFLLRKNAELHFGAFGLLFDNTIVFQHSIAGSNVDGNELNDVIGKTRNNKKNNTKRPFSDELFANLNQIADKIKVGQDIIPDAKQYSNPEYKLTRDDKLKSGGFGDLF